MSKKHTFLYCECRALFTHMLETQLFIFCEIDRLVKYSQKVFQYKVLKKMFKK